MNKASRTMKRVRGVLCLTLALTTTVCSADDVTGPGRAQADQDASLTLVAEPTASDSRTYRLRAEIIGGADNDKRLYCVEMAWEFGDGPAMAVTPSCAPWTADIKIQRQFTTMHTYEQPGRYLVKFTYGSLNATRTLDVR